MISILHFFAVGNADCADMWKSTAAAGHLGTYISIKNILNVYFYVLFIKERKGCHWNMTTKVQKKYVQ